MAYETKKWREYQKLKVVPTMLKPMGTSNRAHQRASNAIQLRQLAEARKRGRRRNRAGTKAAKLARSGTLTVSNRNGTVSNAFKWMRKILHAQKLRDAGKPLLPWQEKMLRGEV